MVLALKFAHSSVGGSHRQTALLRETTVISIGQSYSMVNLVSSSIYGQGSGYHETLVSPHPTLPHIDSKRIRSTVFQRSRQSFTILPIPIPLFTSSLRASIACLYIPVLGNSHYRLPRFVMLFLHWLLPSCCESGPT